MALGSTHLQDPLDRRGRLQERTRHHQRRERKALPHHQGGRGGVRQETSRHLLLQGAEDDRAAGRCEIHPRSL